MEKYGIEAGSKKKIDAELKASVKRAWKQAQKLNPISAVFGGMLTKYIKCNHCSNINTKSEPFISLSLSLGAGVNEVNASATSSFNSTRKPNSNSFSRNENTNHSPNKRSKQRNALSENQPPPDVESPKTPGLPHSIRIVGLQ